MGRMGRHSLLALENFSVKGADSMRLQKSGIPVYRGSQRVSMCFQLAMENFSVKEANSAHISLAEESRIMHKPRASHG